MSALCRGGCYRDPERTGSVDYRFFSMFGRHDIGLRLVLCG